MSITFSPMKDHKNYLKWETALEFLRKAENLRDKALFATLLFTGRRVSEILNVKVKDIDFNNKTIKFKILKKRKEVYAVLPISDLHMKILIDYIERYGLTKEDYLFPARKEGQHLAREWVYSLVKKYAEKYKLMAENGKPPHPHTFRHTFATYLAKSLKDLSDVKILQDFLQHSNIDLTFYYVKAHNEAYRKVVDDILLSMGD